jgi:hypothetical protein
MLNNFLSVMNGLALYAIAWLAMLFIAYKIEESEARYFEKRRENKCD